MREEAYRSSRAVRLSAFLGLVVCCGDDESGDNSADAGHTLDLGFEDVAAPELCTLQNPAALLAGPCLASSDCGPAGICVGDGQGGANCAAICYPEACDDPCPPSQACFGLALSDGSDFRFDANGDGSPELWGACFDVPDSTEVVGAWQACGVGTSCDDTSLCARVPGRPSGTCFPRCEGLCGLYSGYVPECVGTSGDGASICVIVCDPANGVAACPEGLQCAVFGEGTAVCSR